MRLGHMLGAGLLTLAIANCANVPQQGGGEPSPPPTPNFQYRDLTAAEKKTLGQSLAKGVKKLDSARFKWTKFPQPEKATAVIHYCATVNAKNSSGVYPGHRPFIAVIGLADGKIIHSTIGALAGAGRDESKIIEELCRKEGLDPYLPASL